MNVVCAVCFVSVRGGGGGGVAPLWKAPLQKRTFSLIHRQSTPPPTAEDNLASFVL